MFDKTELLLATAKNRDLFVLGDETLNPKSQS